MFRIGQKVVCVDASRTVMGEPVPLIVGTVYEISYIDTSPGPVAFRLMGVDGNGRISGLFNAARFRPVVEKKTDISVFEEILKRETVDDRAPAHSS
jgi:hypothetical protein